MLEDGGFIYIDRQKLHCYLQPVDNRMVLKVNMFDDNDIKYHKAKRQKENEVAYD